MFIWIDQQNDLEAFCERVLTRAQEELVWLAVDTEFMREQSYWPKACLIQIGFEDTAYLIDPLAKTLQLAPLKPLLSHSNILKLFHAGRQDLEIFWHMFNEVPSPIWDTQVAAMGCGFGDSVSFDGLAGNLLKVHVDKSSRFTDWSRRPLSSHQLQYAVNDVLYLLPIAKKLHEQLNLQGRLDWIQEEVQALQNPSLYQVNLNEVWQKIRAKNLKPKHLVVLRALARERESEAMRLDVPKSRLIKDEFLVELSIQQPQSVEELQKIRGLNSDLTRSSFGRKLIGAIQESSALPSTEWPRFDEGRPLPPRYEGLLDLLRMLLKITCDQNEITPKMVASKRDLEKLIVSVLEGQIVEFELNPLEGWRAQVFGSMALDIIHGRKALAWQNKRIRLVAAKGTSSEESASLKEAVEDFSKTQ